MRVTPQELEKLKARIEASQAAGLSAHQERLAKFREYLRQWRNLVQPPAAGEEFDSNFSVPYTQGILLAKYAKVLQGMFGDDAEIVAEPSGPSDVKTVKRVGKFLTVATLRMMTEFPIQAAIWIFQILTFGRAFVYREWVEEKNGAGEVCYEGPKITAISPDDIMVPPEEAVTSVQKFSWVHRGLWLSPEEFLEGMAGPFNFAGVDPKEKDKIVREVLERAASGGPERGAASSESVEILDENSRAEGVSRGHATDNASERIRCWECWMWWRELKPGVDDADEFDFDNRVMERKRIRVHYLPETQRIIGVRPAAEIYARMTDVIPIDDAAICQDGTYWTMGIAAQTFDIQEEKSDVHNNFMNALELASNPPIFFEESTGLDMKQFRYGPKMATSVKNAAGIKVVAIPVEMNGALIAQNMLDGYGERSVGSLDGMVGRSNDRPNAPRTLGGQMLLAEQSDTRSWIDMFFLRQAFGRLFRNLWEMWVSFGKDEVFFRITEEEANGLFELRDGGSYMTAEEFAGRYDFTVKFATSAASKQAKKQEAFEMFQADMGTPLIQQDARAQWAALNRMHQAMGDDKFSEVVPEPPEMDRPKRPQEEHAKMQQGELVVTHPGDNDQLHLVEHKKALQRAQESERPDGDYIRRLREHMAEQQMQANKKMLMRQLVDDLANNMMPVGNGVPGLPGAVNQPGDMTDVQEQEPGFPGPLGAGGGEDGAEGGGFPGGGAPEAEAEPAYPGAPPEASSPFPIG